mmetsp:Transcript_964/g.2960  ORF Transcript_964/g.2960 Transcript_964/m.2960 type:complete len:322 (-) Transcript_964:1333-2298(-)
MRAFSRSWVFSITSCSFSSASALSDAVQSRQRLMVASPPPEARRLLSPLGAAVRAHTLSSCSSKVLMHSVDRTDHSLSSPSAPLLMICVPELMKQQRRTLAVCPSKVFKQAPSARAQSRMVRSPLAVATTLSTGENVAAHTPRLWPLSVSIGRRFGIFHTRAVLSALAVTIKLSSGETATALMSLSCAATAPMARRACSLLRPAGGFVLSVKEATSQTLMSLSAPPLTTNLALLQPKATALTALMWPFPTARGSAASQSQRRIVLSLEPETSSTRLVPSGIWRCSASRHRMVSVCPRREAEQLRLGAANRWIALLLLATAM